MTLLPAWMLWSVALTLVLALAGVGTERALQPLGFPARWVWLAMALLSVGLPLAAWVPGGGGEAGGAAAHASPGLTPEAATRAWDVAPSLPGFPFDPISLVAAGGLRITEILPSWIGTVVALLWALASLATALVLVSAHLRLRRHRRGWEDARVLGRPVLISPWLGPAVVGIRHPEVVIPRELLDLPDPEVGLILLHEESHAAARDTLTLAVGLLPAVLFPWNPVLWWMLSRLRRGVELDCDRRILRTGVPPARYARLLLTVATGGFGGSDGRRGHGPIPGVAAPALVESTSLLERRIRNMKTQTSPTGHGPTLVRRVSSVAAGLVALSLVVLACESEPPTGAGGGPPVLLGAEELEDGGRAARLGEVARKRVGDQILVDPRESAMAAAGPRPRIFVDGVEYPGPPGDLADLAPESIERVEVLKGAMAEALFGAGSAGGVIQISTKRADPPDTR